jgi:AcrR family transcriptional regulator
MPARKKTKRNVVSEFRSAEILESARRVFAKKGFAGATMDEIAAAAGLAKGTLYLYFESKRDVYLKTLRHGSAELWEQAKAKMQAAEGVRAKIRALIGARARYGEEHRDFYRVYLTQFGNVTPPAALNKELRELHLKQTRALEQALRDGVERGEIQPLDVEAAAFTIQDMARGLSTRRLLGWSSKGVDEDVEFLCDLIWTGIGRVRRCDA